MTKHSQETPLLLVSTKKSQCLRGQRCAEGSTSSVSPQRLNFHAIDKRKIGLLLNLLFLRIFGNICLGLPGPFLAREVESKGGTIFDASIILQARSLSAVIFSPIVGHFLPRIGIKNLIFYSVLALGLSLCAFSALPFINALNWFIAVGIASRFIFGAARTGMIVAITTVVCCEFPEHVSLMYGLFQGFASAGYLIGPSIGGALYDKFGMFSPIVTFGISLIFLAILQCLLIPKNLRYSTDEEGEIIVKKKFLLNPITLSTLFVLFTYFGILAYADTALTIYFKELCLSVTATGIALGIWGVASAVFAFPSGYLATRFDVFRKYSTSLGSYLVSASMFLFSPYQTLPIIYLSCFLVGVFSSAMYVPAFETIVLIANNGHSSKNRSKVVGYVTGIYYLFSSIGTFIIPSVASLIQTSTSADFSMIFYGLSILNFVLATIQGSFMLFWKR